MITVMVVLFFLFLFTNVPILFSIGLSTMVGLFFFSDMPLLYIPQAMFASTDSFELLAIPFFILAGGVMKVGGISRRLVDFINTIVGSFTGGLATVTVISCMFFGAISGSAPATTAAIGSVMVPYMVQKGYNKGFSAALVSCSGGIGIMIPPSIPAVVYSVLSGTSVASMFAAGIGPGITVGLVLIAVSYVTARHHNWGGAKKATRREMVTRAKEASWALFMPVLILGGIYGGIFTPTEAAAVSVIYSFIVGIWVYKEIKLKSLKAVIVESAEMTAVVMILISVASVFSGILTDQNVPRLLGESILAGTKNPVVFLLLINTVFIVIGCFMSVTPALIILTPLLVPLLPEFGINPVHFGQILVINMAIGALSPPFGVDMFIACGITKIPIEEYARKGKWILLSSLISLLLVTFIPEIAILIPKILGMKLGI
jgi:C4-dicarboxylate transporter, DctM subunit